ncbi:1-phosphofructokinase family hexose kinase [Microbacterium protaetiae]|uniref:1-phosphofructokinase family hexose kinase n=1 Tax=Microbacterium protaetiae TaxID=2509458 RepID=A0A4P6EEP7_9MICO|nr:1-phosphofructokinase family hexose kinase [Microbacterium protaetiae]QAY60802.1 1-phosphofructokinase family hexose kinase [Microbacterium protaetiae]
MSDAAGHAPILTVTVNPALDVTTSVDRVVAEHKMRCGSTRLDPGGGGINVSRAIRNLGGISTALYTAGGPTGQAYRQLLEQDGITARAIRIAESTRESFTVDELSTGEQFRFVLQGPQFAEQEWRALLTAVEEELPHGGYVVASGSIPPGVPADFYARIAHLAASRDAHAIIDSSGASLRAALDEGVHLVAPSRRELAELVSADLDDLDAQIGAAQQLIADGRSSLVALTLGGAGAVMVSSEAVVRLPAAAVTVRSTVGAGDAFLAGLVLRLAQGHAVAEAFRTAVAAGAATAALPGTALCDAESVARLEHELDAA